MEPLQIALIVLVIVAVWAVVEIALTARRARTAASSLDRTVDELNEAIAETKPVIAKLDGALDDLQPAIARMEPLIASANVAIDALSADLVEVEAVVRDVSSLTGAAASAGSAVSGVADATSNAVQRLLGKRRPAADNGARTLDAPQDAAAPAPEDAPAPQYYTYDAVPDEAPSAKEEPHA